MTCSRITRKVTKYHYVYCLTDIISNTESIYTASEETFILLNTSLFSFRLHARPWRGYILTTTARSCQSKVWLLRGKIQGIKSACHIIAYLLSHGFSSELFVDLVILYCHLALHLLENLESLKRISHVYD